MSYSNRVLQVMVLLDKLSTRDCCLGKPIKGACLAVIKGVCHTARRSIHADYGAVYKRLLIKVIQQEVLDEIAVGKLIKGSKRVQIMVLLGRMCPTCTTRWCPTRWCPIKGPAPKAVLCTINYVS